jgi:hypothetical protein
MVEENISTVKERLVAKIEWLQERIPIANLKIHNKINLQELKNSTMSNLYMLEQQLMIIKRKSRKKRERLERAAEMQQEEDNG